MMTLSAQTDRCLPRVANSIAKLALFCLAARAKLSGVQRQTQQLLPHSGMKRSGVHFREGSYWAVCLPPRTPVLSNIDQEKAAVRATREGVREIMDWENIMPPWLQIFGELSSIR